MNIEQFYFPVKEQDIALINDAPWTDAINGYKAIVAPNGSSDKVISVVKKSYKLVPNKEIIEPFMEQVSKLGVRWKIDSSHSFCQINRMRLQITFPDILLKDQESDIALSLFLHNSYDQSEGIRLFWGAIRSICTNGMVFGNLLGSFYSRHTKGFDFEDIYTHFGKASDNIHKVQQRINHMQDIPVDQKLMEDLQAVLGKRRMQEITQTDTVPDQSQWHLLNDITYFISHDVEKDKRAKFQLGVSKVLAL
ncbi:MAG: DUF932 domain-containing protein [Balneolaceae bacterium]|nr:DUF932 domain-containing protein [Balneolaceae bacterium]